MRWSKTLIPTLMQLPADAPSVGAAWMARAGLIRQTGTGSVAFLPLGVRSLNRLSELVRDVLEEFGFAEVLIPQPKAGEPPMGVVAGAIRSYRQLPQLLYQIDRGAGAPPSVSAFAFSADEAGIREVGDRMQTRLLELFRGCRIGPVVARMAGGVAIATFSPTGETKLVVSDTDDYPATHEVAEIGNRPWNFAGEPAKDLEKVRTPGMKSVAEVCGFLNTTPDRILKTLVFAAESPIAVRWVVAVVRGDRQVNPWKLATAAAGMGVTALKMAEGEEAAKRWPMGFVGPDAAMKFPNAVLIVDPDAARGDLAWTAGGNEFDVHVRQFNWFRECGDRLADPVKTAVADIRNAVDGDPSPSGTGTLCIRPASVLAELTQVSVDPDLTFDDASGRQRPLHVAAFRVDLQPILTAVVEASHDARGIVWPKQLAPASVVITTIGEDAEVQAAAEELYTRLNYDEIDVVLDDRDARAGSKFADADLVGFPVRITVGARSLKSGEVELKRRAFEQVERVGLGDAPLRVRQALSDL